VVARGRYTSPTVDEASAAAHRLTGVGSHTSAALHHGWPLLRTPDRPHVTLPINRKVAATAVRGVNLHRTTLAGDDVVDGWTSPARTLLDCLRRLPFDEGLALADSALRSGFSRGELLALARDARGPGSAAIRRVAQHASAEAANPFESGLRACAVTVVGLDVRPQVAIHDGGFLGRPDLVDERLRIVVEADSFEWHGSRTALRRDAQRYNAFVVRGWLVLRFSWEDVMFDQDYVRRVLVAAVAERSQRGCMRCGPA
jgi:very-short-patch-repair endonuclease